MIRGVDHIGRQVRVARQHLHSLQELDVGRATRRDRLPEDAAGDQKRIVTPFDAIRSGADYLVVGRPITKADDPVAAARRFAAEMKNGREAGRRGD